MMAASAPAGGGRRAPARGRRDGRGTRGWVGGGGLLDLDQHAEIQGGYGMRERSTRYPLHSGGDIGGQVRQGYVSRDLQLGSSARRPRQLHRSPDLLESEVIEHDVVDTLGKSLAQLL